jgi:hypothetical protein
MLMSKSGLFLVPIIILLTAGCQLTSGEGGIKVISHPSPEIPPPSMAPFEAAGCTADEFGNWSCPEDGPLAGLGCDAIGEPGELLGGLEPANPIARCLYFPTQHLQENPAAQEEDRFYNEGCLRPVYVRYVISKEGQFVSVNTLAELQAIYAPLESPEEALSYAVAATGLEAKYGLEREPDFRYFQDTLEDTHVEEKDGGYEVLLYHYQVCGCGPHTTSVIQLQVSTEGEIQEVSSNPIYEDPSQDGLCVD